MHTTLSTVYKGVSADMTMCDETVRDVEMVCNLLHDPPHLWSLLEVFDLYHSWWVVIDFLHKPGALVKKPHQSVIHCMVKLLIWVEKQKYTENACQWLSQHHIMVVLPLIAHCSVSPALKDRVLLTHLCLELVMNWMNPPRSFSSEISEGNSFDSLMAKCLRSLTPFWTSRPSMSSVYHIVHWLWISRSQLSSPEALCMTML